MLRKLGKDAVPSPFWLSLLAGSVCGAALIFVGYEAAEVDPRLLYVSADWTSILHAAFIAYGRNLFWFGLIVLFGFSAIGAPFLWCIPFWYGLGDGFLIGLLLRSGWNGLPAAMRVLCSGALTAVLLVAGCAESLRQCNWLCACLFLQNRRGGHIGLQGFLLRFVWLLLLLVLCACADAAAAVACGILAS